VRLGFAGAVRPDPTPAGADVPAVGASGGTFDADPGVPSGAGADVRTSSWGSSLRPLMPFFPNIVDRYFFFEVNRLKIVASFGFFLPWTSRRPASAKATWLIV